MESWPSLWCPASQVCGAQLAKFVVPSLWDAKYVACYPPFSDVLHNKTAAQTHALPSARFSTLLLVSRTSSASCISRSRHAGMLRLCSADYNTARLASNRGASGTRIMWLRLLPVHDTALGDQLLPVEGSGFRV